MVRCLLASILALAATELRADASWRPTGALASARAFHSATLLDDGRVLVVGGTNAVGYYEAGGPDPIAELYDPATGTWSRVASPALARTMHTATLLLDGRVLVVGGFTGRPPGASVAKDAEVYDPRSGTWSPAGMLAFPRAYHTATLLADGRVLVAGGWGLDKTELFDPATNTWTAAGSLAQPRYSHTATLLLDGTVLIAGGGDGSAIETGLQSGERYDPVLDRWTVVGKFDSAALAQSATLLPSGGVLVTGGYTGCVLTTSLAERFEPRSQAWSPAPALSAPREGHTATLLANGDVLVAGGNDWAWHGLPAHAESALFDERTDTWKPAGRLVQARGNHTATLLRDGRVLVVGGIATPRFDQPTTYLASAELFGAPAQIEWCKNHYILMRPCNAPS